MSNHQNPLIARAERLEQQGQRRLTDLCIRRRALQNFVKAHGYAPRLKNPVTFSEKLLFRKLQQDTWLEEQHRLVDKHAARAVVRDEIGESLLIPQLGYLIEAGEFSYQKFTPPIILKATHGSGWNLIVRHRDDYPEADIRRLLAAWLACNYADAFTGEAQYRRVPPGIVIEPLLTDQDGKVPVDYKFHCFNQGETLIVQTDLDRFGNHGRDFYNSHWQSLDLAMKYPRSGQQLPTPDNLDAMVQVARQLSSGFDYVRIDLYSLEQRVYFGEITLVPGNACEKIDPSGWDERLGELWPLRRHSSDRQGGTGQLIDQLLVLRARLVARQMRPSAG